LPTALDSGCGAPIADTPYTFDAVAYFPSGELVSASTEKPQAGAYYLAMTVGPGVDPSVSARTTGDQWLP